MMRRISTTSPNRLLLLLCTALIAFAAGCATHDAPVDEPVDTGSEFRDASAPPPPASDTMVSNATLSIAPVYFDLDESVIKSEFESLLKSGAAAIREAGRSVTIEGHCDERGSEEYNVALGERRGNAVRSYLYNLGVPNSQMTVVSYGEARPAVNGTGETAWQLNRRAQFVVR